jgi:translation initiation factor IF-3
MAHSCVASTVGHSLFNVFVLPALTRQSAFHASRLPPRLVNVITISHSSERYFSRCRIVSAPSRTSSDPKYKPPEARKPRNNEIRYRLIQVVNAEGRLDDPVRLQSLLRNLDDKTHYLEQVTPDDPEDPDYLPVCRIVNKKEEYELQKGRKSAAKAAKQRSVKSSAAGAKTVELSWAIDAHDLSHRLGKLKDFLSQGRRVEVAIAKKKLGRLATTEECENLLRSLKETVESVPGVRELKSDDEGQPSKLGAPRLMTFVGKEEIPQRSTQEGDHEAERPSQDTSGLEPTIGSDANIAAPA